VPLPDLELLRTRLRYALEEEAALGVDVADLREACDAARGYDALNDVAIAFGARPALADEPEDLDAIWAAADPSRDTSGRPVPDAAERVRAAWYGSVTGCILGKPFEIATSLPVIRAALEKHGEWPLADYPSEAAIMDLPWQQPQWPELVKGRITHAAADDDMNYSVLGMRVLERKGRHFTGDDVASMWRWNLPIRVTFGPERAFMAVLAAAALEPAGSAIPDWVRSWNPNSEWCGALIRVDAYGYGALGDPALAAEFAYRDASLTHRRTGVYASMFFAAAIAAAPLHPGDPLGLFRTALQHVPQRSRFADAVRFSLDAVDAADDWLTAYETINARFGDYGHCRILQEVGTVVNSLRFARDVGHGVCLQVMQGNDTDSFGATCGSILGAYFGPGHLEDRWTAPFNDTIQLALATTWESSISALADRMAALPALVASGERGAPNAFRYD
jgi:ADP-ribosylglycohydrolase